MAGFFSKICVACGNEAPCAAHPGGLVCNSVSLYRGVNRDIIRSMKYSSHKSIAKMMGGIMARHSQKPQADFLVPIPLHKGSQREYNQAELIAKGASEVWGIPVKNCLRWKIKSTNQASAKSREHRTLPAYAMEAVGDVGRNAVCLVDDVITSGNTLLAASRALEASGAAAVGAIVWGRSG
jgi:predicted amidophosphoribosyltransferase